MIEQFRNLKSDVPDNLALALKLNEVMCVLEAKEVEGQKPAKQSKAAAQISADLDKINFSLLENYNLKGTIQRIRDAQRKLLTL